MRVSKIKRAKPDIEAFFHALLPRKIFNLSELSEILQKQRHSWHLPQSLKISDFLNFMLKETQLSKAEFDFPYRKEIRFIWGQAPLFETLMSIKKTAYFSHFTAMYLNDITDQIPRTIYINSEQAPPKTRTKQLDQKAIDNVFRGRQRISKNSVRYLDYEIRLISGMGVGRIGVVEREGPEGEKIRVTDIERTLIDIAVRPEYSGGVFEVFNAFKKAAERVSSNRLAALLGQMNFIYPYHQVIGFYLERTGFFNKSSVELFRKANMTHDFYLAHGMKETEYSERWRLYFPKGF